MRRILLTIPAFTLVAACSGNSGEGTGTAVSDGGTVTMSAECAADTRKDIYVQGLAKTASDLDVEMTDSEFLPSGAAPEPGQVQKGMNTVTFLVLDAQKQPVDGATVNLKLWMPDHQHGTSITPTITPMGGGQYKITNVWLFMPGLWQFELSILQPNQNQAKTTDFNFCISG